ncbi:type II toxin-antitoxin system HicB family antitoxin [Thalassobaculum sp. OXR-137]|uniref:type II toxin-antitoxin system HicB family antitoxin n=1 Tax=Thalassobaculum sp. OXR-137 TaxID=3100173 RepID=UPI002AC9B20B|nr:type II toxin-antitoxin system HicB family antitoxin [Thalassobaculum sp. OXR-137]WPZ36244.1 type II toxin-antitoxin system HicB family antitoxin [Thalassobaculum sp. OXR-137]
MVYYVGIIHRDEGTDYGISFPDFPGCVSAGETVEALKANAEEALAGHIQILAEDGASIPSPSSIDTVMADPDFSDGMPVLVAAPDIRDETIRINLTMRRSVLASIDRNAAMHGLSRSAYLAKVGVGSS